MQYNSQLKKLVLPEYGRNVQQMVDHCLTIEDKEERAKCANTIINIMGNLFPHLRDVDDFKHKLWDHLAIMSDFKLDIEYPYEVVSRDNLYTKPEPIPYKLSSIRYKHYGKLTEELIKRVESVPEGEERDQLLSLLANHMKKSFHVWNKEGIDDEKILADLVDYSRGKISLENRNIKLREIKSTPQPRKNKNQSKKAAR